MKFSQMPYERADLKAAGQKIGELAKELKAAKSGEEQFEIHKSIMSFAIRSIRCQR